MTKILNFVLKIKGGCWEGGTCEVLRPCHPPKIWKVHMLSIRSSFLFISIAFMFVSNLETIDSSS